MLCFRPSRSLHFCVFIFHEERVPSNALLEGTRKVEMFLSSNSMWHVYSDLWDPEYFRTMIYCTPHLFLDGYLFAHSDRDVLVLEELKAENIDVLPANWTIEELKAENIDVLPANWTIEFPCHRDDCIGYECVCTCTRGCLGQSSGIIHYAMAEDDGCTVLIWSYATSDPNGWTLEHSLSMRDAFGRDDFVHYEDGRFWTCDYEVIDFDLERDVLFLIDGKTSKLLSYGISTVSNTKEQKMDPEEEELSISMAKITDDLVVEILSCLPYKSFCRFKCVSNSWLDFSFYPHYSQKLPKVPTGFFYQDHDNSTVQFASLSKNDEGIDGTLRFLPHYEQLKFIDCCNGLVLCEYRSSHTSPDILSFIVCNPATREWRILPDTQRKSDDNSYTTFLCFDPSWSPHFCVYNFHEDHDPDNFYNGTRTVEMFSSRNSMWLVYPDLWDPENLEFYVLRHRPHVFMYGFLYAHSNRDVLVLEGPEAENLGVPPRNWTTKLPLHRYDCFADRCFSGCLGQFEGILHYAVPERDGCTVLIWSYYADGSYYANGTPFGWNVVHSLSMRDAYGRDDFVHYEDDFFWTCDYEIIAFDLERDALFLIDRKTNKLLSYGISTGKLNEIKDSSHWCVYRTKYYVACYLKIPDL